MPVSRSLSRRDFVKAAVAIGGAAALSACQDRESPALPQGPADPSYSTRQHAWNDALPTDEHGNDVPPRHHVVRLLDYRGEGTPTTDERETLETALHSLERAYPRRHEADDGPAVGLLFTVGYSPAYFERFDVDLPGSVDLPEPGALAPFEDPTPDRPDVAIHLASDYGSVALAAEEALFGERDSLNGVEIAADVAGILADADLADDGRPRRTGFIGAGLPAENQDVQGVPDSEPVDEDAPLFMGFESGFKGSQATEDRVTLESGPLAGGTTQHLSAIELSLKQWYEQDSRFHREATMFCPAHADEGRIEGTGENLGATNGVEGCADDVASDARETGKVGHAQKVARAREDGMPRILRRDFDSTDGGRASVHFLALQSGIGEFVATRQAMNGTEAASEGSVGQRTNNGILQYISVERRGNYLLPPRELRAFPTPRP
ncbi:MAG: twin-arginine translocation signal domain-containing protein [Haloarculaceae archaeon]